MNQPDKSQINVSETFPHLSHAPITEAVIEIRARGNMPWNELEILPKLKTKLAEYPNHQSARGFASQFQLASDQEPRVATRDLGWQGLHFTSSDKMNIAKFQLDLFSFSRLQPYENWEKFSNEALRLWKIHAELSQPTEIERVGVRFINRFPLPPTHVVRVPDYFKAYADDLPELKLELSGFFHQETMTMPEHPFAVNVIKTVQSSGIEPPAFILDIDVFTRQPFDLSTELLESKLLVLHWLKNKAFFGIITENLKESLRE